MLKNEQRRQETRNSILNAATHCFALKGYDGTGVALICEEAGVSKGAFYYHFQSKEAVFLELINNWLSEMEKSLENIAMDASPVPETLINMTGMLQAALQSENVEKPLFLELWIRASRDENIRQNTILPYRKYRQLFTRLIEQGIAEGSLKPVDPDSAAQAILSLASGMFLQGLMDPKGADWEKAAADSIKFLLEGLKQNQEG